MTILDEIAAATRERAQAARRRTPQEELRARIRDVPAPPDFFAALAKPGLRFICEIKKASPSKGVISEDFPYLDIARSYESGGADAVSCLTEPRWFLGSDEIFADVQRTVSLPLIRKDFTVDPYQIWEARTMGASAVLLICAILDEETLLECLRLARELGMSALVETHDEGEIETAQRVGARIIGVNNRNLKDFSVSFDNAARLRGLVDRDRLFVAESGVSGPEDVRALEEIGADAALVGEYLMRSEDPAALLRRMRRHED